MLFNVIFNNISDISWRSVLLVEEIGVLRENPQPVASHWQTWSNNVVSSTPREERDSNSVSDDSIGSCNAITTTTDPAFIYIYIRLKIKPNSVRIRSLSWQMFVFPSTGFELTPLIHCRHQSLSLMSSAPDHSATSAI